LLSSLLKIIGLFSNVGRDMRREFSSRTKRKRRRKRRVRGS